MKRAAVPGGPSAHDLDLSPVTDIEGGPSRSFSSGEASNRNLASSDQALHTPENKPTVAAPSRSRVLFLVAGHATSAASLLVVNKWALKQLPYVWSLATLQFVFAASATYVAGRLGYIEVDALEPAKLIRFFPAAGMFFVTITAGNAVVAVSNVDTFIVMRSLVPIPSAILESLLIGEPCPSPKSWVGLGIILCGAILFCSVNQGIVVGSTAWVVLYLLLMPLDGVLIKHLVNSSGLSPWGLVLYNNVCAATPGIFFAAFLEHELVLDPAMIASHIKVSVLLPVAFSCLAGLSISYFQMNVRGAITSTAFMVLGVSNKFLTVFINQLIGMDANADIRSLGSVLLSIAGAIVYQQTVTGKGMSQPKKPGSAGFGTGGYQANVLVLIALFAAAWITYSQGGGHQAPTTTILPALAIGSDPIGDGAIEVQPP